MGQNLHKRCSLLCIPWFGYVVERAAAEEARASVGLLVDAGVPGGSAACLMESCGSVSHLYNLKQWRQPRILDDGQTVGGSDQGSLSKWVRPGGQVGHRKCIVRCRNLRKLLRNFNR